MNVRVILSICFKVVGVFYALLALNHLLRAAANIILYISQGTFKDNFSSSLDFALGMIGTFMIYPVVLLGLALWLIFKSDRLARYLQPMDERLEFELPDDCEHTSLLVGVRLFGVAAILAAIPSLSSVVSKLWVIRDNMDFIPLHEKIVSSASVVSMLLYIGVGIYMMLRPHGVVWLMTRGKGRKEEKVEPRIDTDGR